MQLFALQTNINVLKNQYLSQEEREVMTVHRHIFSFVLHLFRPVAATVVLIALATALILWDAFSVWPAVVLMVLWVLTAGRWLLSAFIDWRYDFLILTTNKLIIVDQQSIFSNVVRSINMEEIASVMAETQWLNLFGFGRLHITTRRMEGDADVVVGFIPRCGDLAAAIMAQIPRAGQGSQQNVTSLP